MVHTKEENLALTNKTKKGRNPFTPNKLFHAKNKEFTMNFEESKFICLYYGKRGHFARECNEKKKDEGKFYASIVVEETPQKNAPEEKGTRREYYLVSIFFGSLIMGEDT